MTKINLGFDIDDTLTYSRQYEIEKLNEFLELNGMSSYNGPINKNTYVFKERYDLDEKLLDEFNNWYFPQMIKNVPVMKNARHFLYTLKEFGFDICIITRRDVSYVKSAYTGTMMERDTNEWIKYNDIPITKIHFSCFDKAQACKDFGVDVLFEDNNKNIADTVNVCPVLYPPYSYNYLCGSMIYHCFRMTPSTITNESNTAYTANTFNVLATALSNIPTYKKYLDNDYIDLIKEFSPDSYKIKEMQKYFMNLL